MTTGFQTKVLTCIPAPEVQTNELCGAGFSTQVVDAFLIDSSQSFEVDFSIVSAAFSASFVTILLCFIWSRLIGKVVGMIR